MNRRLACVMSTVLSAWVIYAVYVFLMLLHFGKQFIACRLVSSTRQVTGGHIQVFGKAVPFWEIAAIGSIVPVAFCACAVYSRLRRRYRARHDRCTECGQRIVDWHGRCPGCGVRIGPDSPRIVHTLRA